ncbi:MAG: DUF29 family protein [Snowella sp.]|nr:DUF29 family protein [Snowella sp.]
MMLEELQQLKPLITLGKTDEALLLIDELEEMGKEEKINKIHHYCVLLLIHLIKQSVENHVDHSLEVSIRNAIAAINRTNRRLKTGNTYLAKEQVMEILIEAYDQALDNASLEAFGGIYDAIALGMGKMIDRDSILDHALQLILA